MTAAPTEGVSLRHVIVAGGTSADWAAPSADQWAVRLADLGKVADHFGAHWLTIRPFGPAAAATAVPPADASPAPLRTVTIGGCLVTASPDDDGRSRLAAAVAGLQSAGTAIAEATISAALNAPADADPDLVVVVGAQHRMPPSLVWELAYSELVFVDTTWAQFCPGHLEEAIGSFAHRHRRFGGID
jgi:undecaprenyl diphosphate synthase